MTTLRQLSAVYVAAASAFTIASLLSAHPVWRHQIAGTASDLRGLAEKGAVAADDDMLRPAGRFVVAEGRALGHRIALAFEHPEAPQPHPVAVARKTPPRAAAPHASAPHIVVPPAFDGLAQAPLAEKAAPQVALRGSEAPPAASSSPADAPHTPALTLAPEATAPPPPSATASLPPVAPAGAADIARVEQRLKESLTSEMVQNFELFLYVSKADAGPWAQHMYVFQKQASGDLMLLYNWPVSTGREKLEFNPAGRRVLTTTPPGYYELDPNRSYAHYRSGEWDQPMPYTMFFNWVKDGDQTGLAIHAASGDDVARLGQRASAGCIHLSEDNARTLFTMIRSQYRGLTPRFAIDRRTGTMSNEGILLHDASGHVKYAEGYKVLVFIEDFGGENVVAALF